MLMRVQLVSTSPGPGLRESEGLPQRALRCRAQRHQLDRPALLGTERDDGAQYIGLVSETDLLVLGLHLLGEPPLVPSHQCADEILVQAVDEGIHAGGEESSELFVLRGRVLLELQKLPSRRIGIPSVDGVVDRVLDDAGTVLTVRLRTAGPAAFK